MDDDRTEFIANIRAHAARKRREERARRARNLRFALLSAAAGIAIGEALRWVLG